MKRPLKYGAMFNFLLFLALVGGAALFQARIPAPAEGAGLLDGGYRASLETRFDAVIPGRQESLGFWTGLRWWLFGIGLEGMLEKDGYLFTTEEWEIKPQYPRAWQRIEDVRNELEARGMELVVLLLPSKSRVLEEYRPAVYPAAIEDRYLDSISRFEDLGIKVLDLIPEADAEGYFLKTDTHWSPEGARSAARKSAEGMRDRLPDLFLRLPRTQFATERMETVLDFRGDLFEYLPKTEAEAIGPSFLSRALPPPETLLRYRTRAVDQTELGLFDDPVIPLALLGTSFSAGADWNFEGFLKEALEVDLINLSQEGLGPFEPMEQAIETGYFEELGVELVIWEIPERYLPVGGI